MPAGKERRSSLWERIEWGILAFGVHNGAMSELDARRDGFLRFGWRSWTLPTLIIAAAVAIGLAISLLPLPFVVYSPGPTFDVLGTQNEQRILEVEGADFEPQGQLRMVTISEQGGPGSTVTAATLLHALVTPGYAIRPYDSVYPRGVTAEELKQVSDSQMRSSHSTASVAALEQLGYDLPTVITVLGAAEGSGAEGKIAEGDRLVSIEVPGLGTFPMDTPSAPFALMRQVPAGTTVRVTVERGGVELVEEVVTGALPEGTKNPEGSRLGVILDLDIDMPLEVLFHLEKVGGPSAGMIFALGIIDELEGGTLTGGKVIAGTGAMHYDGTVEPIGGVEQKMYGALRDGAEWFLAPASNCDSVVGNVPDGLNVGAVGTLAEAVDAVRKIASDQGDSVPTCEAILAAQ